MSAAADTPKQGLVEACALLAVSTALRHWPSSLCAQPRTACVRADKVRNNLSVLAGSPRLLLAPLVRSVAAGKTGLIFGCPPKSNRRGVSGLFSFSLVVIQHAPAAASWLWRGGGLGMSEQARPERRTHQPATPLLLSTTAFGPRLVEINQNRTPKSGSALDQGRGRVLIYPAARPTAPGDAVCGDTARGQRLTAGRAKRRRHVAQSHRTRRQLRCLTFYQLAHHRHRGSGYVRDKNDKKQSEAYLAGRDRVGQ